MNTAGVKVEAIYSWTTVSSADIQRRFTLKSLEPWTNLRFTAPELEALDL